jgi:O-antigen/teichoic acid export membrane protein
MPDEGTAPHGTTTWLDERNNRNLNDLLQELRVAGLGVQVLFGFLLSLPFTVKFGQLDGAERDLYRASLLCAALSTALLVSPVAYHRWVFRRHEKGRLLRVANVQALLGLSMVALAVSCAVWLVLIVVGLSWPVAVLAAGTTGSFAVLWFVLPVFDRLTAATRHGQGTAEERSGQRRSATSSPA